MAETDQGKTGAGDAHAGQRLHDVRRLPSTLLCPPFRMGGEGPKKASRDAAVFLDRDGVMIVDKGYVHRSDDVDYVHGIFDFCRQARSAGFRLVVATNQSGIARGLFGENDFRALSVGIIERFASEGIAFDAFYYCPHHPTEGRGAYRRNCFCRKPRPGMLLAAFEEFRLTPARCVFLGDRQSDMDAAQAAGLGLKLLLSAAASRASAGDAVCCRSLAEAGEAFASFAGQSLAE